MHIHETRNKKYVLYNAVIEIHQSIFHTAYITLFPRSAGYTHCKNYFFTVNYMSITLQDLVVNRTVMCCIQNFIVN